MSTLPLEFGLGGATRVDLEIFVVKGSGVLGVTFQELVGARCEGLMHWGHLSTVSKQWTAEGLAPASKGGRGAGQ